MERINKAGWAARAGAMGLAFVLGASASAGTLYSWKTEDGTFAYTNDKKRIPAKYKAGAETSNLGKMQDYERFTPGPAVDGKAYEDRIVERLEVLRGSETAMAESTGSVAVAGTVKTGPYVRMGVNGASTQIDLPVGLASEGEDPVVVEHVRVRKSDGRQATRHMRVVRQGDKVLAVIKDRANERSPSGEYRESDFE